MQEPPATMRLLMPHAAEEHKAVGKKRVRFTELRAVHKEDDSLLWTGLAGLCLICLILYLLKK
jgi:hypothetical protein